MSEYTKNGWRKPDKWEVFLIGFMVGGVMGVFILDMVLRGIL